jgi:hypothetical protein
MDITVFKSGDVSAVRSLEQSKLNALIVSSDASGFTPLILASKYGHRDMVDFLLNQPVCAKTLFGTTRIGNDALMYACMSNDVRLVDLLVNAIKKTGEVKPCKNVGKDTWLHWAATSANVDIARSILLFLKQAWKKSLFSHYLNFKNATGVTPLMCAAQSGKADLVKLFLENEAYTLAKDSFGRSAKDYVPEPARQKIVDMIDGVKEADRMTDDQILNLFGVQEEVKKEKKKKSKKSGFRRSPIVHEETKEEQIQVVPKSNGNRPESLVLNSASEDGKEDFFTSADVSSASESESVSAEEFVVPPKVYIQPSLNLPQVPVEPMEYKAYREIKSDDFAEPLKNEDFVRDFKLPKASVSPLKRKVNREVISISSNQSEAGDKVGDEVLKEFYPAAEALDIRMHHIIGVDVDQLSYCQLQEVERILHQSLLKVQQEKDERQQAFNAGMESKIHELNLLLSTLYR